MLGEGIVLRYPQAKLPYVHHDLLSRRTFTAKSMKECICIFAYFLPHWNFWQIQLDTILDCHVMCTIQISFLCDDRTQSLHSSPFSVDNHRAVDPMHTSVTTVGASGESCSRLPHNMTLTPIRLHPVATSHFILECKHHSIRCMLSPSMPWLIPIYSQLLLNVLQNHIYLTS